MYRKVKYIINNLEYAFIVFSGDMMDKSKYKKEYKRNTKRRLFKILMIMTVISFVFGVFYVAVISNADKSLIKNSFEQFFEGIHNNHYNQVDALIKCLLSNVLLTFLVWILGISIIGIPVSILYLIFKSFVFGFSFSSIIYTYGVKGIMPSIIYSFPLLINLIIIFLLTFYAVNFSQKLYLLLFKRKDINLNRMVKVYSKFLVILLIIMSISCFISSYVVPILINSFTNKLI